MRLTSESLRWDATYHAFLPASLIERLSSKNKNDLFLPQVADIVNDRVNPKRNLGQFKYIEISDVDNYNSTIQSKLIPCEEAPSRATKKVLAGDVIVSTVRPEKKKIAVVSYEDNNSICSSAFVVLRPIEIDSLLLAELLKTDFITNQLLRKIFSDNQNFSIFELKEKNIPHSFINKTALKSIA